MVCEIPQSFQINNYETFPFLSPSPSIYLNESTEAISQVELEELDRDQELIQDRAEENADADSVL